MQKKHDSYLGFKIGGHHNWCTVSSGDRKGGWVGGEEVLELW